MPDITFIHPDGEAQGFEAPAGVSAMQAATGAGVRGIVAECGGSAMCATCHVYVDPAWIDRLPAPLSNELEMLECTADLFAGKIDDFQPCIFKLTPFVRLKV